MVEFEVPEVDYTRYSNRQLLAVPLAVLGIALAIIVGAYFLTGTPVTPGVEFTGGTEFHVATEDTQATLQGLAGETAEIRPVGLGGEEYIITVQPDRTEAVESALRNAGYTTGEQCIATGGGTICSISERSAAFGERAQQTALLGVAAAFVGMSILIFVVFRSFVPSIAVVASAFSDIMIPVALMNVFGIKLSLGAVAALLMLIGYSVDSDILLNNHILRRRGGFYESTYRAMRTGVTMTLTSLSAMIVMAIVSRLFGIPLLPDIALILVFGLAADLMNTYMMNVSLLRWYKYEGVAR
ncbi:protein translocase subunit SecF [Halorhabdus amylolytica]|uniref:protein translocase subunit SecF n=1 Tax=Halorhabdus amylolytica TaxID=2559573 RepID=UPI0010AA5773|nr:protein translocase subunit SecF [Halorhabdus amylolytica]